MKHARRPLHVPDPSLPHERDERPDPPSAGARRGIILQASRDLAAGQVDTDNYTRAREIIRDATEHRAGADAALPALRRRGRRGKGRG